MHFESVHLHLMTSKNTHQLILLEQLLHRFLSEIVRAFSLWVFSKVSMFGIFVLHWICPHQIAKQAVQRNFLESIDGVDLLYQVKFW